MRFDGNDYSVPAAAVRRNVEVLADHQQVRIVADGQIIAEHERSFDRRASIEDPSHTEELRLWKRKAKQASAGDRLRGAAPSVEVFLHRGAERGHNLGGLVTTLLPLLDAHGATALEVAVAEVNEQDLVSANAVRLLLEQKARAAGKRPVIPVWLPREELATLTVRRADLAKYDRDQTEDGDV